MAIPSLNVRANQVTRLKRNALRLDAISVVLEKSPRVRDAELPLLIFLGCFTLGEFLNPA
jgi:hypothetical protein